jgi:hypothetical protein
MALIRELFAEAIGTTIGATMKIDKDGWPNQARYGVGS